MSVIGVVLIWLSLFLLYDVKEDHQRSGMTDKTRLTLGASSLVIGLLLFLADIAFLL